MTLLNPASNHKFLVTMWDTPDSNGGGIGGALASVASAAVSVAMTFLVGGFSEVEGLEAGAALETIREGGDNANELRFFNYATYPKITFKRGVTFSPDLWDWHHQIITGKRKTRKSGTIMLIDKVPVGIWTFHNALPEKISGPGLKAKADDHEVAIETLEIRPEKVERVSLSMIPGMSDIMAL
jgi:phage tail-like protein